jgi:CRISPR-associated endonuclease/helicase Cas3
MSTYFAHSTDNPTKSDWQSLDRHLAEVARRSGEFAARFGAEEWGRACGLFHDLGKFSREFQARLEGGRRVDHATAGARQVYDRYGPAHGMLLAYAVAGHHSGLADGGVEGGTRTDTLRGRLDPAKVAVPAIRDFEPVLATTRTRLPPPPTGRSGFSVAFFVRMLYSCLVDADFLDTESWLAKERTCLRGGCPTIAGLREPLDRYLEALSRRDTPVNQRRAEILASCRGAATLPQGIFSLTVPTGGGKTLSSLAFALRHASIHGLERVVYAIPYTSIIEQNAAVFRSFLGEDTVLEHHSNFEPQREDEEDETSPALRMRLTAENWDAPVVVTTNVQLFGSLFAARSSRCRKLHNLARSVIILDEAQMLPTRLLQPCLAALRELAAHYGASVVLCTATQPALQEAPYLPSGFAEGEVRQIIPDHAALYEVFRRVDVRYAGALSDADVTARVLARPQVLCVVNTRAHARKLFERMGPGDGHLHLSALLCPAHRAEKLIEIRKRLKAGEPCRVISTQLVEAGVDVDFPAVVRAATGIDSIAQAAGRCNREGKLPGRGDVTVFDPECGLPPGHFRRTADVGALTARAFSEDLLSPEAVRHYFTQLYSFEGADGLDAKAILRRIEVDAKNLSFPFREVSEDFRLIENEMESLIIPYNEQARNLIRELRHTDFPAAAARKLQRYTVQVYRSTLAGLCAAGVVEIIEDRFQVLMNESLYRDDLGLCPEDPTFRDQEDNVF